MKLANKEKPEYIVGVDIGSSKVTALIAGEREGELTLLGFGVAENAGMRRGSIINLEATTTAISHAVEEAELMAGVGIEAAYVGVGGGHIKGINSRGSINVPDDKPRITKEDVDRVIGAARAIAIPSDREVIHLLPQEFTVDDDRGIEDPVGFSGRRLEVGVHLVTAYQTSVQNVVTCAQNAGLAVQDTVLTQLASSLATLSDDEKDLGVVLLDIGAGTTDMAVFVDGFLCHSAVLTIGGDHITNDIAVGLRTPIPEAEKIKIERSACLKEALENAEEPIEVTTIGEGKSRVIDNNILVEIVNARCEEIFHLVKTELERIGVRNRLNAGIVLTGGSTKLRGLTDLAEQMFELPTRMAVPIGFRGIVDAIGKPQFSTAAGLTRFGYENRNSGPEPTGFFAKLKEKFQKYTNNRK